VVEGFLEGATTWWITASKRAVAPEIARKGRKRKFLESPTHRSKQAIRCGLLELLSDNGGKEKSSGNNRAKKTGKRGLGSKLTDGPATAEF